MAQYDRMKHYSDFQISPAWHQWLHYTRFAAPSTEEQRSDIQRQLQLKQLAQLADERWVSKKSYLDAPKDTAQPAPATLPKDPGGYGGQTEPEEKQGVRSAIQSPYKQGAPSENWQPESWQPGAAKR